MRRCVLTTLVSLLAVSWGWCGELAGVKLSDEVTISSGTTLHLNGMGLRKKLWVKVYVAGLYLEQKSSDPEEIVGSEQSKRFVMHFMTDRATKSKMDEAWDEGFANNSPQEVSALKQRIETFKDFFGDMKEGDVVQLDIVPGEPTAVSHNGAAKGSIEGDDFAAALLRVYLGPAPPTDELKDGLLGG